MLFCKPLETTTTGMDIFQLLDAYFKKNTIDWLKCDSICSDGAPALTGIRSGFRTMSLGEFWLSMNQEYNTLKKIAVAMLLQFSTSYLCEKGFSSMLFLKNKYRNRLEVEHDLRVNLYKGDVNFREVISK
jgi:hAT family C-terminal dimerisation region